MRLKRVYDESKEEPVARDHITRRIGSLRMFRRPKPR